MHYRVSYRGGGVLGKIFGLYIYIYIYVYITVPLLPPQLKILYETLRHY